MLICDTKQNNINLYMMIEKQDEVKEFKKQIIKEHTQNQLFYELTTNSESTIRAFNSKDEINITLLVYDYIAKNNQIWSKIASKKNISLSEIQKQEEILEAYINGEYDNLVPIEVFKHLWDDGVNCCLYRFLKIGKQTKDKRSYKIDNILNLPKQLYFLALLKNGIFEKVMNEDIERQLKLFELEYVKSISLDDIATLIDANLINSTLDEVISKTQIGSKILSKMRKL